MTKDQAIAIARAHALRDGADELHAYLPRTAEEAALWDPHAWVVAAICEVGAKTDLLHKLLQEQCNVTEKAFEAANRNADLGEAAEADAARFRWLTKDHADPETRAKCRELLGRLGVMSYSAACTDIDSAMANDIKRSMLRAVDAHVAARKEA